MRRKYGEDNKKPRSSKGRSAVNVSVVIVDSDISPCVASCAYALEFFFADFGLIFVENEF